MLERRRVGAGASWGNAGWLAPAFAVPLPEPGTLRAGLSGIRTPSAPLYVPLDPRLAPFLTRLARNSTRGRWHAGMAALAPLNRIALDAHAELAEAVPSAVSSPMRPCLVAARHRDGVLAVAEELERVAAAGQHVEFEVLTADQARSLEPTLTEQVGAALRVHGQRWVDPGAYLDALAGALRSAGVRLLEETEVTAVRDTGTGVRLRTHAGPLLVDAVVLAGGAMLNKLARRFGVRTLVRAGRGYSFTVTARRNPRGPVYFPTEKVVLTPLRDGLRVAGMMEFRPPDAPLDPRRIDSIVAAARGLVRDVDWDSRTREWVGARPCTTDGLPLIGPTLSPRVHVAGGHGMWGITHAPATGKLLAEAIVGGTAPVELAALHPLR